MSRDHQTGFTLIEIMVVILIMGLALGVVSLSIGRDDGGAATKREAEDFMLVAHFVSEQAVLNSQIIAFFIEPRAAEDAVEVQWCYRWQQQRDNRWQDVSEALPEHCLSPRIHVDMIVENEPYEHDPDLTPTPPVLVFYPSGESTSFEMALYEIKDGFTQEDTIQRIEVDMMAGLRWLNEEEAAAERATFK